MKNTKNTKKNNNKGWYLVYDGESAKVTKDISEAQTRNVVIIKLSADDAAEMLSLTLAMR